MNELLKFWQYVSENYDGDCIDDALENNGISAELLRKDHLAKLNADELNSLFGDIINVFMDVSGTDNYGDVFEILTTEIEMNEAQASEILG